MSSTMRWSRVWILGYGSTVLVVTGCSGGSSSTTTDASTTATSTAAADSTSTSAVGSVDDTRGTSSSDATGVSFLPEPDVGDAFECDIFAQDCPPGERCTFWAEDGGYDPTTTRCVPLADDPAEVDEPCHMEGTFGVDDCGIGLICLDVDPETQEGVCVPLCAGGPDDLYCEDPDRFCQVGSDGWIFFCRRICNPLLQDCLDEQGCYPLHGTWACIYDASDGAGAYGDWCMPWPIRQRLRPRARLQAMRGLFGVLHRAVRPHRSDRRPAVHGRGRGRAVLAVLRRRRGAGGLRERRRVHAAVMTNRGR